MNVRKEIQDTRDGFDLLAVGRLAAAFTLLSQVPFDSWNHEGDPAEMAVLVIKNARDQGRLTFVHDALGLTPRSYSR